MENEDKTPFSITGDIPRRSIVKYHKMLDLKDSKINFKPKLCLVCCNDVSWIDGKDLYEVLEDKMRDIKFDCELKKFGTFKDVDGMNIVYIKIELPQTIKQLRQEIFKRIKYVGSDTAHDKTNTPHIEIARFKGKVPTLPTFEPETMSIKTLRFLYEGNVKLEQTF
jgi:hypothetical protein